MNQPLRAFLNELFQVAVAAAHPGTKIDIQFVPWAQAHDKFTTAIAGGKVPDVAEMGTTWTPEFADQGGLVEQPKISKGDYVSSLVDAATLIPSTDSGVSAATQPACPCRSTSRCMCR